jgi:uncharacterized protein YcbX
VPQARVLPSGALEQDRRFALVDRDGNVITAKRSPLIHRIRSNFDLKARTISLEVDEAGKRFHLDHDRQALEEWFSQYFSLPVKLIENAENGFPDDVESPGPTIISTATLKTVAGWFGLPLDEIRRRFRANLVVEGVEPLWEDSLYAEAGAGIRFQIGVVKLIGTNPCQRCVVPSRDSGTGEVMPGFAKTFASKRERILPTWADKSRFDHYYRLATNTRAEVSGILQVGDEVQILQH